MVLIPGNQQKCVICGTEFEPLKEKCPNCGANAGDAGELRVLIIGGGASAQAAAKAAREKNKKAEILLLSEENSYPYNRPMLTKALDQELPESRMLIKQAAWYAEQGIEVRLNTQVTQIVPEYREVLTTNGEHFAYDRLIIATGARCFVPPIPGADQKQVMSVRSLKDARLIRESLPQTKQAVVVGGGVLGLELAWSLNRAGVQVTILEVMPRLMPRQLDEEISEWLKQLILSSGVQIVCQATVERITEKAVLLADGQSFPADLVLVSAGIKANTDLARSAGIATDRGIVVNESMQTNVDAIYASGDCAQYGTLSYGVWPEAVQMGECAGSNAVGGNLLYRQDLPALSFMGFETALYVMGDVGNTPTPDYRFFRRESQKGQIEKYVFHLDRLVGFTLTGDIKRGRALGQKMLQGVRYSEIASEQ